MAGNRIRGITIEIGGDTQPLQRALSDVNKSSRELKGELRDVERLLKLDPKNTELLAQRQQLLGEAVETTREKLDRLRNAQEQVNQQFQRGEISAEQYRAFQREVAATEQELQRLQRQVFTTQDSLGRLGQSLQSAGKKISDIGGSLTKKVTMPVAAASAAALKLGMDFEAGMSEVQAISGATGSELERLSQKAKEMGSTTKFSATESAEAMKYMAMAGWDTQQMVDGLGGVMSLAAASGEDLASVSDIVTDALTAFGLQAKDASQFADLLAKTSTTTNTNVGLLGESFKYVAPLFGALKYNAEDAALALGLMANAGIKGSQAGTSLKTSISNLANPTAKMATAMDDLGISLTDAEGNMLPFRDVLLNLREAFSGLDESQQAAYAATIFGKEAMAGMLSVLNATEEDFNKVAEATQNYAGTAEEMADVMQDNAKGSLVELKSALEGIAIDLSQTLIPIFSKFVAAIRRGVDWFANLDDSTKEMIVKIGLLAAAIGPALVVIGKLVSATGAIFSAFSAISGAIAVVTTGAAAATPAIGALASAFTVLAGPVGIAVGAIALLTAGGISLYNHLKKDSIPEVERFGKEVSESTQQAAGAFLDLNDQATMALNQLNWSGQEVTADMADSIVGTFQQMGDQVLAAMEEDHAAQLKTMQSHFAASTALTEEEEAAILEKMKQGQADQKAAVEEGQARIAEIMTAASEAKRALTEEEKNEINRIQQEMVETGTQYISENELEQKAIMERMRANAGALSARQAAEVVQNSVAQRDGAIKAAEEQYNDVLKEIIRQRDEAGTISAEQADKLIAEAKRQRDETIASAEEMHQRIVEEAKAQAGEHVDHVNWETGEILSRWQKFKGDVSRTWNEIKTSIAQTWEDMKTTAREAVSNIVETVKSTFKSLVTSVKDIGKDIVRGLWEGISSMASWIGDKVSGFAEGITKGVKGVLGINSPSKVFAGIGKNMAEGLNLGFGTEIENVKRNITDAIPTELDTNITVNGAGGGVAPQPPVINIANMVVRNDEDIQLIARELHALSQGAYRGE